jgi:cysteinyl-tRNA synthetase
MTRMKIYNTLSRSIEELSPLKPPFVTIYTCGPTVYDYAHIGHWFNYVRMDMLIRTIRLNELTTKWVMNITDVGHLTSDADEGEDKLEKGARREGKTAWQIAEYYADDFFKCMHLLHILTPDFIVKATEHINEQIALIKMLEEKDFTYIIDDGVYYDTARFPAYADFAQLNLDEQQAGARVAVNSQKRNQSDFALWKFSPKGHKRDMEWGSPWGTGFPGWHIECSAMSMKYLGDTLDIHTGGIDHIPVHHTNEIAQSEAATGKRFANIWLHSNHVMVNGEKISKSLGNGIRLQEIMSKGISTDAVRLHILESHYRSQSKFSWDSLIAAQNRLKAYQSFADLRWQLSEDEAETDGNILLLAKGDIVEALSNDLDTPRALARFSQLEAQSPNVIATCSHSQLKDFLIFIHSAFGIPLDKRENLTQQQLLLFEKREKARINKQWQDSDSLRNKLEQEGIGIRDATNRAIWYRK